MEGVIFEPGVYGLKATLTDLCSDSILKSLTEHRIQELVLGTSMGWRPRELIFLKQLSWLKSIRISGFGIDVDDSIHELHELRSLSILTYAKSEIRFSEFPQLEECVLEWRPKATSVFQCTTLKKLFLNCYRGKDSAPFGNLINLESLTLLGASLGEITAFRKLTNLRHLRLALLRRLTSLEGIQNLQHLEELEIGTCSKIRSIELLRNLITLRGLMVDNCGEIESLKPIQNLQNLEWIHFVESTNILDGDMSPLLYLPKLTSLTYQNRRHYSHRREEFAAYGHAANPRF